MKRTYITNFVNWILWRNGDLQVCKTNMGDILLRRCPGDGTFITLSTHGKDEVAGYNAMVTAAGLPSGYRLKD